MEVVGSGFQLLVAIEDRITEELHGQEEGVVSNQAVDKLIAPTFSKIPPGQLLREYTKRIRGMRQLAKLAPRLATEQAQIDTIQHFTDDSLNTEQRDRVRLRAQELDTKGILIHNGSSREEFEARTGEERLGDMTSRSLSHSKLKGIDREADH